MENAYHAKVNLWAQGFLWPGFICLLLGMEMTSPLYDTVFSLGLTLLGIALGLEIAVLLSMYPRVRKDDITTP